MKKKKSTYAKASAALLSVSLLFACSDASVSPATSSNAATKSADTNVKEKISTLISGAVSYSSDDEYSDWKSENPVSIELNGTDAEFDSSAAVLFEDGTLTIKAGGTYVLSGSITDGQIVVDAEDKKTVKLVLNGVDIRSSDTAAIHVVKAEKATVSLAEGTKNTVSDGKQYVFEDSSEDEPNAAIFSKSDLTINGPGQLTVSGNYNNGITSKDNLKITGGTIQITAADDGLMGRDLIAVKDGKITIHAGGDGIKSSNDKDTSKGNIALEGGTYNITAANDGIQSEAALWITNGSYTIASGGGSPETVATNDKGQRGFGQEPVAEAGEIAAADDTETTSAKGLKANADLLIGGGTFTVDSVDDAVHSNANVAIGGGEWSIASGDDGIHADASVTTSGGNIKIAKSYEGIEGTAVTIKGGSMNVIASDDGINVGGGNDGSGMDFEAAAEDSLLTINGGNVSVNASGDGLDSNGSIVMTAGTVLVNGPTETMNGTLDYDGSFDMTGGFLIAAGNSSMVQSVSEESAQLSILMTYPETQKAGTMIHVQDSEGNEIATYAPAKDYQSVVISSPDFVKGSSYSLYSGGTSAGSEANGLYADGQYQDGIKVVDFTVSDTVTWLDENGVTEAGSSGFGGSPGKGAAPPEGSRDGRFGDVDEEMRKQIQEIMIQEREGSITEEEAQAKLSELGVELPSR